jgi:Flp pilus assembly pilin Flp
MKIRAEDFGCGAAATEYNMILVLFIIIVVTAGKSVGINLGGLLGVRT